MSERRSIADYVARFLELGDECVYVQQRGYRSERWSYRRIAETAIRFARELEARGIGKGDRVMLWGENCAEWVGTFFGCALSGAVAVPMDDAASPDFAARVAQSVNLKLLVGGRQHVADWSVSPAIVLEELASSVGGHDANYSAPENIGRDDVLQIVFTSGTTADPKGVIITHGNVLANVAPLEAQIRGYLKYARLVHPIRFLNLLPLSHVFGQFLGMFLPPILGGTVIFQEDLKPSEIVRTIKRERVSVLVSVPKVLQSLKQKIERDLEYEGRFADFRRRFVASQGKHFLHRWWIFRNVHRRFGWKFWAFISGGAALDSETEEFWGRLGYAAIQGYGLTETTSLISVNHPFKLGKGSIGKVLPGREVKLADDGEILVRGGGISSGYWDGHSEQKVSDDSGWYRTGDIGALDAEGNLYFKGRKKEVIVTPGGTNVHPEDLEAALRQQPEVKDCVVVGIEREGNAEPCAVVIVKDGAGVEDSVQRANALLAEHQRMRMWLEWPEQDFPRTSTQKPKRKMIQEWAQARILRTEDSQGEDGGALANLIFGISKRPVGKLDADARLDSDLGLSSLDRVELFSALEDRYHIELSDAGFSTANTVGDLERMLRGDTVQRVVYHYPTWTLRWPTTWIRFVAYYLLMRPAILLLGWPRIEGRENLRGQNGPFLVVANHIAHVDAGFILTALPARIRNKLATAAGGERLEALRTPPPGRNFLLRIYDRIGWILGVSLLNIFPLPRAAGFRQSFAYAGQAVDRGYSVLVFPEGRHTVDGKMNPFRAGIGLLANNLGIPVLPMRIDGLYEYKSAGKWCAPPWKIRVRIGKPINFEAGMDPTHVAQELQAAVERL